MAERNHWCNPRKDEQKAKHKSHTTALNRANSAKRKRILTSAQNSRSALRNITTQTAICAVIYWPSLNHGPAPAI